ncbi:prolipoprotein diacylglyceryl transferase [bacterium]|nr:prolipoprotein diacylglyceryl transferase [bacterium]
MHPILFKLGGQPFYSYGLMVGLALYAAYELCRFLAEKDGIAPSKIWKFALGVIAAGFIGSHIHARLSDPTFGSGRSEGLAWNGFTFYGAAISGTLAAYPVARLLRIPFWKVVDAGAPCVPLAHGIGRIGCFLFGCDYGIVAEGWWKNVAVSFPRWPDEKGSPAWVDQVQQGLIPRAAEASLPVVPVQLIEMAAELVIAAALVAFFLRRPRRQGTVVLVYFLVYGVVRPLIELLRGDLSRGTMLGVSTSTAIGIVTFGLAALLLSLPWLRPLREEKPPADADSASAVA